MAKPDITLLGATYNGVSGVSLPKDGGGTATFPWVEGSQKITQNNTYNVSSLAQVVVEVSGGSAGFDCPIFNVDIDDNLGTILQITCNKTFSECYAYLDDPNHEAQMTSVAVVDTRYYDGVTQVYEVFSGAVSSGNTVSQNSIDYLNPDGYDAMLPFLKITYNSDESIEWEENPIARRSQSDLSVDQATVIVPAGYYEIDAQKSIANGVEGTPTSSKGTVSNHSLIVTPSVTNSAGYISGGTKTGPGVSVSATELVSGTKSITSNGTNIDVTNYKYADVSVVPSLQSKTNINPTENSQTITADNNYDGLQSVQINGISSTYVGSDIDRRTSSDLEANNDTISVPAGYYESSASKSVSSGSASVPSSISGTNSSISTSTNTLTLTTTVSVTPVVSAGYISSGTATNSSISLSASVTIDPTPTASGAIVTIPSGYYSSQTTKSVSTMSLPTSASSSATSGYSSKATISRSTADQYINIPPGYNSAGGYYKISAVANGSVTSPSSISGSSATLSTGTNTLTLTKTVSVTPNVTTAGYISSGTAGNSSVSLTASVTTKSATTYNTSSSDQTISSGTYLTGTQTIKAVTVSGLSADKILSGTTVKIGDSNDDDRIASVVGSVVIQHYYTGSSTPSSSLGSNGDIYLQTEA